MTADASGTDRGLSATRACYCLAARRRARELTRLYEEKLRPHGLRATQFSILAALALKGPTLIGELADILGLERTTLTRSAGVLERNGWVETSPSDDARERPLQLTPAGRRKLEGAYPAWQEAQEMVEQESEGSEGTVLSVGPRMAGNDRQREPGTPARPQGESP